MKKLSKEELSCKRWYIFNPKTNKYEKTNYYISVAEYKILGFILEQKTCKEIAVITGRSVRTIEGHKINLLRKTNSINSVGLVLFCVKNNLI